MFAGGAPLEAIEAVSNPGRELGLDTLDAVVSPVDKSLVRRLDTAGADPRFGMLETIREFAMDRLIEAEHDEVARRHAKYFARLAEIAEPHFVGAEDALWLGRFELGHDNIRSALRWAVTRGDAILGLRCTALVETATAWPKR